MSDIGGMSHRRNDKLHLFIFLKHFPIMLCYLDKYSGGCNEIHFLGPFSDLAPRLFISGTRSVTAKYFMVFVFPFWFLKFLCSNHMTPFVVIFCGYVFPRTVNETKKAIILCIS